MASLACPLSKGRLRRSEAGATAIEFALVVPILVFMFGAIFETGAFILAQNQLQFATDNAARQIRTLKVGPKDKSTTTPQKDMSEFKDLVCSKMATSSCANRISVDVQNASTFADLSKIMPDPAQEVGKTDAKASYTEIYKPGGPGMPGSLIVTYDWEFSFPGLSSFFGNVGTYSGIRRLAATVVFRNEGLQ